MNPRRDVLLAEDLLGRVQIVCSISDPEVRRVIAATERAGLDVISPARQQQYLGVDDARGSSL